jgi:hypothetical protein
MPIRLPPPPVSNNVNDPVYRDWFYKIQQILSQVIQDHNNLDGLQGGTTNEYYHLTSSEYTGTGTGDFVRENNPDIISPNVDNINFDTTNINDPDEGQLEWNADDGTLEIGMAGGNVVQQIGMEQFYYAKADTNITDGQCIMATGTVGNSGKITCAPAQGLGVDDGIYIMGVATENISTGEFGYITAFGLVRGINATGASVGETWADGDVLYYNPAYVGGLTKVKPDSTLYPVVVVALVIHAVSNGSIFVRPSVIYTNGGGTGSAKIYEPVVVEGFDQNVIYLGAATVPAFVTNSDGDVIMAWGGGYAT